MIKLCRVCGKEFETYDKRKMSRNHRRAKYRRPINSVTCSKKCARVHIIVSQEKYQQRRKEDKQGVRRTTKTPKAKPILVQ